jgi:hypothetical protein
MAKGNRRSQGPSSLALLVFMLLAAAGVAGLAAYVVVGPGSKVPPEERGAARRSASAAPKTGRASDRRVLVPVPDMAESGLQFTSRELQAPAGADPKVFVVNEFLRESGLQDGSVKLLAIDLRDGVAKLDFEGPFGQGLGSLEEGTLLMGLRAALGQFPDVSRIEVYVDSVRVEELGHIDLAEPQSVIRPADWGHPSKRVEEPPPSPER